MNTGDAYLELLKSALRKSDLYPEPDLVPAGTKGLSRHVSRILRRRGFMIAREYRGTSMSTAYTMLSRARLDNIQECVDTVLRDDVPGDLIETGVWRGGASIFMRGVLAARGDEQRRVYVADSFAGLPPVEPRERDDPRFFPWTEGGLAAAPRRDVEANFARFGFLDDRSVFVEGWFSDTLPALRDRTWSVVRLDGDTYESTEDALDNLYPGLSPGGFLIVDDYGPAGFKACRESVNEYRRQHRISEPLVEIDDTGVYWRKSGPTGR